MVLVRFQGGSIAKFVFDTWVFAGLRAKVGHNWTFHQCGNGLASCLLWDEIRGLLRDMRAFRDRIRGQETLEIRIRLNGSK